jgi:hypothetical protein
VRLFAQRAPEIRRLVRRQRCSANHPRKFVEPGSRAFEAHQQLAILPNQRRNASRVRRKPGQARA